MAVAETEMKTRGEESNRESPPVGDGTKLIVDGDLCPYRRSLVGNGEGHGTRPSGISEVGQGGWGKREPAF